MRAPEAAKIIRRWRWVYGDTIRLSGRIIPHLAGGHVVMVAEADLVVVCHAHEAAAIADIFMEEGFSFERVSIRSALKERS